ncbi:hypothetical protein LJR015_003102 [Peribacillus frigoritolerans]|nr:hypothetical protein [Peribacillus simplex]
MLREIRKDEERISDECPIEELEQKMLIAMEHTYTVKLKVWDCGL